MQFPVLEIGMRGSQVAVLKNKLRELHYAVDGGSTYTGQTADAVTAFQKVNGIDRDGRAGPRTQAALRHPRGVSVGAGPASRVVVDLSDQVLMLVRGGHVASIVDACTGNANLADGKGQATPVGTFNVYRKVPGVDRSKLGVLYSPSYFHGGVAVHGEPSVPVQPSSHGCVRIPMASAQSIYDAMPVGMQVVVRP